MTLLRITGWAYRQAHDDGPEVIIEADHIEPATVCLKCGVIGNLYKHGTKLMTFRDTPMYGKPCVIEATVQRYKCRECGETFMPFLNGIDADRRMTVRCIEYVTGQCLKDTFVNVSRHVGCAEGTIRNIAGDRIDVLADDFKPYLPDWLGLDETKLAGEQRCVITDIGARRPIDVLRNRDKQTVLQWLWHFRHETNIKGMTIDMWRPYLDSARLVFPGLPVVVDKFHVVRMANQGLDSVRIRIQNSKTKATRVKWKRSKVQLVKRPRNLSDSQRFNLAMWLDNEPEVAEAYRIKEAFFNIYDMPKDDGIAAFDAFSASVPKAMRADFKDLLTAIGNWRNEIISYFDYPITNGYTEALNGVAKRMNRAGSGYSFEVIRARVLHGGHRKAIPVPVTAPDHGRCECCQGLFPVAGMAVHIVPLIAPDDSEVTLMICANCHRRFHTTSGIEHEELSTSFCD